MTGRLGDTDGARHHGAEDEIPKVIADLALHICGEVRARIAANVGNRIRWQNHWHVVRQSWTFFQNDFAGRIANRVMQTGPAMRESLVALLTAVLLAGVYCYRISAEERMLDQHFGDAYVAYRARTWRLMPFVW